MSENEHIVERTLSEKWVEISDKEIDAFLPLLNAPEIEKKLFLHGNTEGGNPFANRLKAIENHKIFKILFSDKYFKASYSWLDSTVGRKYCKSPHHKLNMLEAVLVPFADYMRHASEAQAASYSLVQERIEGIPDKLAFSIDAVQELVGLRRTKLYELMNAGVLSSLFGYGLR